MSEEIDDTTPDAARFVAMSLAEFMRKKEGEGVLFECGTRQGRLYLFCSVEATGGDWLVLRDATVIKDSFNCYPAEKQDHNVKASEIVSFCKSQWRENPDFMTIPPSFAPYSPQTTPWVTSPNSSPFDNQNTDSPNWITTTWTGFMNGLKGHP